MKQATIRLGQGIKSGASVGLCLLTLAIGAYAPPAAVAATPPPLEWGACPPPPEGLPDAGQECATLTVPKDYEHPGGQKITVAVSRIKAANPAQRRGVLFSNPGGPGGGGLDLPRVFSILMPQEVLDRYDLIGFDPRGIGSSTPVSCGLNLREIDQVYVPLAQPGGFGATTNLMRQTAERCRQTSGDLLPYITTPNTARDMEQLRLALGESKISYLGYSYGTALGATYASLYPNRTDRFVLDSSVGTSWQWRNQFRSWKLSDQSRWPDFANFLTANNDTYHFGSTQTAVRNKYFQLFAKMDQQPITLGDGTIMNGPMFMELTFNGFYSDDSFPDTATIWQIADGQIDPSEAATALLGLKRHTAASAASTPEDSSAAAGLAILCGDTAWSRSPLQYQLEYTTDKTLHPLFGALGSNIWTCAFWSQPIEPVVPVTANGPANKILIMQNLRDPATPLAGALQMRTALGQRARMVTVDQGGHAIYLLSPNTCANTVVTNYLVQGTYPAADTSCPADPPEPTLLAAPQQTNARHDLLSRMRP